MGVHEEFAGVIGRDWRDSTPAWPPRAEAPVGAPERGVHRPRRRRLRAARLLRVDHRDPQHRRARRRSGVRLANFHTAALCSPTRVVSPHRPEPPLERDGPRRRPGDGLPRVRRRDPVRERLPLRDPARRGLLDLRRREVAPHARRRDPHGCRPQQLAARPRLRPVVRVPRRRDAPVRADALLRQPLGAAAAHRGGGLPPHRGPGRPRHRVPERPPQRRRRAAVLPLLLHRSLPLAAPRTAGVDREVPRRVRRRVGRAARTRARAPDRGGHRAGRAPSSRRARRGCRRGTSSNRRTRRSRRGSWSASPASSRTPTPRSAGCSRTSTTAATPTTRSSCSCPTTAPAPRAGRPDRSTTYGWSTAIPPDAGRCAPASTSSAGPSLHNNYPWGWTMAGNTPFKRWKREVHEGGVADPCIVRWPARFAGDAGADPPPVRARHRRAADRARADRRRRARRRSAPRRRARSTARASPTSWATAVPTRPAGASRSTSRCSARARSTTTGGRQ